MADRIIQQNDIIKKKLRQWNRVTALLDQDEEIITEQFARKFPNETDAALKERKEYFAETFLNMTRDLVSAPVNSLFRQSIADDYDNENSMLKSFHDNVTLGRETVPFLRYIKDYVGLGLRSYGNVFTVVDKPRGVPVSRKEEREAGLPYLSNIVPQDVLDWQYGVDGELLWFAYQNNYVPIWEDPFRTDQPISQKIQCLWTRERFEVRTDAGKELPELGFNHMFGFVPVVIQASFLTRPNDTIGSAAMDQTSNWIVTIGNLYNLLVHELYKHGGSMLAMHEEAMGAPNFDTDADGETLLKMQNRGGVLAWLGEHMPEYLLKQLATDDIMKVGQWYIQMATENERDLKSVVKRGSGDGDASQSGVAKMLDREPLEANLVSLAEDCETYSTKINDMAARMLNQENDYNLEFDKDFDFRSLKQKFDEIESAQKVSMSKMSPTLYKEMHKNLVGEITRDVDVQDICITEIDNADDEDLLLDESINKIVNGQFSEKFKENGKNTK